MKQIVYKVRENEDVTFTIPIAGTPKPEAEWFTSGTVVKSTPHKKKTLDEDSASLTIKKVVDDDAGEYTIKLTNPVGDVSASLKLIILSKSNIFHIFTNDLAQILCELVKCVHQLNLKLTQIIGEYI